jgi:hypothetical protein
LHQYAPPCLKTTFSPLDKARKGIEYSVVANIKI